MTTQLLPFSLRIASTEQDMEKAVRIRHDAYYRHLPGLAAKLLEAEEADFSPDSVVLLAESHLDREPLGTMRIHTNHLRPLPLEQSVKLPSRFKGEVLAEAARLGIVQERVGALVKNALFKAFYAYCRGAGVDRMVITGRNPVDRMYDKLLFSDVCGNREYFPMAHVANLPHRVMEFSVWEAESLWRTNNHPLYRFMCLESHPDIDVGFKDVLPGLLRDPNRLRELRPAA